MAFLVVFVAAYVFGGAALRAFRFQGVCESLVYRIAAGLPLCALLVLALGSVSLSMAQIALYLVAAIGLGRQLLGPSGGDSPELPLGESAPPFSRFEKFCLGVLSAAAVLTFLAAATPVTQDDALPVLGLVQDYYREGRVFVFEGDPQCGGPHLMPCLFAYAFHESGEQGVTLLNWAVGLLGCGALFLLTDRIAGRAAGLIAAAMFSTAPVFFDQAQGASCHLMLVTLSVTALAAWQTWYESEDRRWLMVAAFLAGSCCGIHPSGWIVAVLIPIGTLLAVSPNRVKALGQSVAYIALGAAPWILRTALLTGNPLYPSGPDEWIPLAALDKAGLTELVWFPWAVVMRFFDYGGWVKSPGCLILFLGVPGLLICGRRVRRVGAYSIAACLYFFFFRRSALEMLPFFVPMMGVAAAGAVRLSSLAASMEPLERDRQGVASGLGQAFSRAARDASVIAYNAGRGLLARHMTGLLAAVFVFGLAVDAVSVTPRLRVVFGIETREDYLDRTVEHSAAFRWLNEHAADGVVLAIDPRSYFIKGRSYRNYDAVKRQRGPLPLEQLDWLRERGISHVLVSWKLLEEGRAPFDGDLEAVLTRWLRNGKYFKQEHVFETVIRGQVERVEIYRVSYEEARGHVVTLDTKATEEGA